MAGHSDYSVYDYSDYDPHGLVRLPCLRALDRITMPDHIDANLPGLELYLDDKVAAAVREVLTAMYPAAPSVKFVMNPPRLTREGEYADDFWLNLYIDNFVQFVYRRVFNTRDEAGSHSPDYHNYIACSMLCHAIEDYAPSLSGLLQEARTLTREYGHRVKKSCPVA